MTLKQLFGATFGTSVLDSRSVRVFVTYSDDSKRHMRHVMQLCECLKKNNFSVSLDVRERALLSQDRIGWYDKRFKVVSNTTG